MSIGQKIRERRTELGMSVEELAKHLGKNKATVYRYEKGEIENLPVNAIIPMCKALDTTPSKLMGWDEVENMAGSEINVNGVHMAYASNNETHLRQIKNWYRLFGDMVLTDEEHQKLIEYTEFLLFMRDNKGGDA